MLKPPVFNNDPICGLVVCPIMSSRTMLPLAVNSSPAGLKGPGIQELQLISADSVVYCQAERCAWYREEFLGCVIHVLMNLRELVDTVKIMDFSPDRVRDRIEKAKAGISKETKAE